MEISLNTLVKYMFHFISIVSQHYRNEVKTFIELQQRRFIIQGDLLWSPAMQSLLLSATFYGGLATIGFAGTLADKYGPKMIMIAVTLDYIIVTLLTPLLAQWSYYAYFVSRIVMGVGEGFVFPCFASLIGRWYAPSEKSTVAALYTSGNQQRFQLAASLTSLISSYLCTLGWPIIFYIFGALGCFWLIFWTIFVTNSPRENKFISEKEMEYLAENIQHGKTKTTLSVPWRKMLTSRPLIAAILCQYTYNMQASLLQAFLPTFLKEELLIPLDKNGIYTMIPFISQMVSKNIFALVADYMKRNNIIGHTKCAKIFQIIGNLVRLLLARTAMLTSSSPGSYGSAASLVLLATIPTCENPYTALPLLAFYGAFFSGGIPGFFTCLLCIAPPFSGSISSIAMVLGTLGNISGPMMLGFISKLGFTQKWAASFIICACLNVITGTIFILFGSGAYTVLLLLQVSLSGIKRKSVSAKVQEWAKIKPFSSPSA
ncbi:transporter, major facilitator family protein [Oesophagostomum dentatum]|uniref:Transporter, major facilitator family protein n=1 Tax=Oesophagostomum dentatum TaxID=61180 RepID=A0A0B1T8V7_OESDE|nr:transporter, major facilitator family protein [Oesophagostomum dentatum]